MKRHTFLLLVLSVVFLTACNTEHMETKVLKERPVLVRKLTTETYISGPSYNAIVKPKTIVKRAFTKDGILQKTFLSQGDKVWIGSYLATINGVTEKIKLDYAIEPLKTLKRELNELEDRYWSKRDTYIKSYLKNLNGSYEKDDLKHDKNEYYKARSAYYAKRESYKNTISYIYMTTAGDVSDILYSDIEGYILKYINAEGEVVGAGYPVAVVASREKVVEAGLTLEDAKYVEVGDVVEVAVNVNSKLSSGIKDHIVNKYFVYAVVTEIDNFPDRSTGTYNMRAELFGDTVFNYGESVDIRIKKVMKEGIFISVNNILNDGKSYVYVVKNGRANRRNIEILDIDKSRALVKGLSPDDRMIVRGYNSISDGYKVKVNMEEDNTDE